MSFVNDDAGRPETVRLKWESIGQLSPSEISVTFDGKALPVWLRGRYLPHTIKLSGQAHGLRRIGAEPVNP